MGFLRLHGFLCRRIFYAFLTGGVEKFRRVTPLKYSIFKEKWRYCNEKTIHKLAFASCTGDTGAACSDLCTGAGSGCCTGDCGKFHRHRKGQLLLERGSNSMDGSLSGYHGSLKGRFHHDQLRGGRSGRYPHHCGSGQGLHYGGRRSDWRFQQWLDVYPQRLVYQ